MPSSLPAKGWDWAIADGMQTGDGARDILCALAILVLPEHQRKGIGRVMVEAMRVIGRRHGHDRLVVPLRPTLKSQYPLTPMERYVRWQDEDGLPFDPWLRLHVRAGATVVGACTESYAVAGTVRQWEEWTGMRFPESGRYVVPGALSPVDVDTNTDRAEYVEANVWVSHEICGEVADALRHEG